MGRTPKGISPYTSVGVGDVNEQSVLLSVGARDTLVFVQVVARVSHQEMMEIVRTWLKRLPEKTRKETLTSLQDYSA